MRANLVARAEAWPWSSLRWWLQPGERPFLDPGPVLRGEQWLQAVQEAETEAGHLQTAYFVRGSLGRFWPRGG